MNPDNMRFECLGKDFLELYRLVAQLPETTFQEKGLALVVTKSALIERGCCNIYPSGRAEIDLNKVVTPDGKRTITSSPEGGKPVLFFQYNNASYGIHMYNRNIIDLSLIHA